MPVRHSWQMNRTKCLDCQSFVFLFWLIQSFAFPFLNALITCFFAYLQTPKTTSATTSIIVNNNYKQTPIERESERISISIFISRKRKIKFFSINAIDRKSNQKLLANNKIHFVPILLFLYSFAVIFIFSKNLSINKKNFFIGNTYCD